MRLIFDTALYVIGITFLLFLFIIAFCFLWGYLAHVFIGIFSEGVYQWVTYNQLFDMLDQCEDSDNPVLMQLWNPEASIGSSAISLVEYTRMLQPVVIGRLSIIRIFINNKTLLLDPFSWLRYSYWAARKIKALQDDYYDNFYGGLC